MRIDVRRGHGRGACCSRSVWPLDSDSVKVNMRLSFQNSIDFGKATASRYESSQILVNIVCIEEKIIGDTTGYRPYVSGLIVVLMTTQFGSS